MRVPLEDATVVSGLSLAATGAPAATVMSCHVSEKPWLVSREMTCPLGVRKLAMSPLAAETTLKALPEAAAGAWASPLGSSQAHEVAEVHQLSITSPLPMRK